ncbi:hypothetical protein Tco_1354507 [Tanacetum coccineum]
MVYSSLKCSNAILLGFNLVVNCEKNTAIAFTEARGGLTYKGLFRDEYSVYKRIKDSSITSINTSVEELLLMSKMSFIKMDQTVRNTSLGVQNFQSCETVNGMSKLSRHQDRGFSKKGFCDKELTIKLFIQTSHYKGLGKSSDLHLKLQEQGLVIAALKNEFRKLKGKAVDKEAIKTHFEEALVLRDIVEHVKANYPQDSLLESAFRVVKSSYCQIGLMIKLQVMGYGELQIGNVTSKGFITLLDLGIIYFSVKGQFCDSNPKWLSKSKMDEDTEGKVVDRHTIVASDYEKHLCDKKDLSVSKGTVQRGTLVSEDSSMYARTALQRRIRLVSVDGRSKRQMKKSAAIHIVQIPMYCDTNKRYCHMLQQRSTFRVLAILTSDFIHQGAVGNGVIDFTLSIRSSIIGGHLHLKLLAEKELNFLINKLGYAKFYEETL